jgi:hypothetical protein
MQKAEAPGIARPAGLSRRLAISGIRCDGEKLQNFLFAH